jgi:hypothetical protein
MFNFLNRGKNAGEIASLGQYRHEREEAQRALAEEREEAKQELDIATVIPVSVYRQRLEKARNEFLRVEALLWQEHLARVQPYATKI